MLLRLDYLLGTAIIICQILYIRQMVSILFYLSFFGFYRTVDLHNDRIMDGLDRLTVAIIMCWRLSMLPSTQPLPMRFFF